VALVLAAAMIRADDPLKVPPARDLSDWYLIIAIAGLVGSIASTRGAIINSHKALVLDQVGYLLPPSKSREAFSAPAR